MRPSGRAPNQMRDVTIELNFNKHAEGSCLIKFGYTHVICMATVEDRVPPWLRGADHGWVTAEYGMLPRSTNSRTNREATRGGQGGRTHEIQRLIGRSLRAITDLKALGEMQVRIDCDVIQADGGTRTASITGGYVALLLACQNLAELGVIKKSRCSDSSLRFPAVFMKAQRCLISIIRKIAMPRQMPILFSPAQPKSLKFKARRRISRFPRRICWKCWRWLKKALAN